MSGITLRNPVANSIPTAITVGRRAVDASSLSLSTGRKVNNDVTSSSLGNNLDDRAKVLDKIYGSVGYGSNVVKTAQSGLQNIANTLSEMLGVINSVDSSKVATRTLDAIFQSKFKQIGKQVQATEFDGRKLLTGELGSDAAVKSKYVTKAVDVRYVGVGGNTLFQTAGVKSQRTINFVDISKIAEGDLIMLEGLVFTMVKPDNLDKTNKNQIAIGTTSEETVGHVVTAIKNHPSEALKPYEVFALKDRLIISQRSQSSTNIPLSLYSPAAGMVDNSQASNISFEFLDTSDGAKDGSFIEIYGQKFVFKDDATPVPPANTTYVSHGADATFGSQRSAENLVKAIQTNPVTAKLISEKLLTVGNSVSVVNIKSTLDSTLLGFKTSDNRGPTGLNLYKQFVSQSGATTYAKTFKIPAANLAGVLNINGYDLNLPNNANILTNVNDQIILLRNDPLNAVGQLLNQGKLSLAVDTANRSLTFYSDIDLGLACTAPVGSTIVNAAISPSDVLVIKPAIDVSKIRNIEGFIGIPKANFRVVAQAVSQGGNGAAAELYKQATSQLAPGALGDGDSVAIIEAEIAGKNFQSVVWKSNLDNLDNKAIIFNTGANTESFTINTKSFNPDFTSLSSTEDTLIKPLRDLFASTTFSQTRDLAIDMSDQKVINGDGVVIGNIEGMTVSLNSTDFSNKQFEDFTVISDPVASGVVVLTATISGREFSIKLKVDELKEGAILKLNNEETGDVLVINIGKGGLDSLSEPRNYDYIATAIKKSLMSIGSGLGVRVGFNAEDVSKVKISDISPTKLYLNDEGEYISNLDLLTTANVRVARQVITNALSLVRAAQASTQGQGEMVASSAKLLSSTMGVTKDASDRYLDTDLVEAASTFAAALKSLLAGTATYQSGERVAAAGLEIIKTTAAS